MDVGMQAVQRALPSGSALVVKSDSERRAEVSAVLGSTISRLNDTTIVVLIATVASVIALMIAAIWQRRGRLNSLMADRHELRPVRAADHLRERHPCSSADA